MKLHKKNREYHERKARSSVRNLFVLVFACAISFSTSADTLSAASYSQDGLVGQWDGIENAGVGLHIAATNYWTDLTGKTGDFSVFADVASFTSSGLKKNSTGSMATNITSMARTDVRTIEVVVSGAPDSGWVSAILFPASGNNNTPVNQTVSFNNSSQNQYREYFFDSKHYGRLTLLKPALETITVKYSGSTSATDFYSNGALPDGDSSNNYWNNPNSGSRAIHIGGRTGSSSGDATTCGYTIHSIRLYNRNLTDAEARRNATIDQIRFFGEPTEIMPTSDACAVTVIAGTGGRVAVDDVDTEPDAIAMGTTNLFLFPFALRAVPFPNWKFSGWTGDFSCVVEGSTSTPVIVVKSGCGRAYHASFEPDIQYVTNGLVGHWDGLENAGPGLYDKSTNRWVDLSGLGGDFVLMSNVASFDGTGLKKNAFGVCATNLLVHTGVVTIESAVSGVSPEGLTARAGRNKWVNSVFLGTNQTVSLFNDSDNTRKFFFDGALRRWSANGQPDKLTVSVIYENVDATPKGQSLYLDGAGQGNPVYDKNMYWGGEAHMNTLIGGRDNSEAHDYNTYGYTVNALRFYNRALNAGEVAYNSAVDRLRFRGLRTEGFAYRLVDGNVQCTLRAWMDGFGGAISMDGGAAVTNCVEKGWVAFGTAQTATFTAMPAIGWKFLGWTGDTDAIVSGTTNDLTVGVSTTRGAAIQARFTQTGKYVQDGLIGFWDARENAGFGHFDADAAAWKDLTGISGDFLLNAASGDFETNALYKARTGRLAFNATRRTDVRTVEAVVSSLPENSWVVPILVNQKQHISFKDQGAGNNRLYFFDSGNNNASGTYGVETAERPEWMTVTLLCESDTKPEKVFVNAVEPDGKSYANWWGEVDPYMVMGGRPSYNPLAGDFSAVGYRIHAVRFYNRKLTQAEIVRNARQDAIRYFGVQPSGTVIIIR